jgi:FkbM family methyltransferase
MPYISIITCCYNLENYILDTYLSLIGQNFTDWEWIIVDDQSEDSTKEIIKSWNNEKVLLIESTHLGNLSTLRNIGIEKASGELIAVLDGDDIWEHNMLDCLVFFFKQNPEAHWCSTNARTFNDGSTFLQENKMATVKGGTYNWEEALRILLKNNFIYVSASCFRTTVIRDVGGFNNKFNRCEDIELWLRLSKNGYTMGYIEKPLLRYRIRNNSLYRLKELEYLNTNFTVYESILANNLELRDKYKNIIKQYLSQNHYKIGIIKYYNHDSTCSVSFYKAIKLDYSFEKMIWLFASIIPKFIRSMIKNKILTFNTLKSVFNYLDFVRLVKYKMYRFIYKPNSDYVQKVEFLTDIKKNNYNISQVNFEGIEVLKLELPTFEIYIRKNTSDLYVYNQVFIEKEYYPLIQLIAQLKNIENYKVKNIIDVGANIGFFTLFMSKYFPDGNFVLIEPDKSNVECCYINTKNIHQKTIIHAPLWSEEKILYLSPSFRDNLHWSRSFSSNKDSEGNGIRSVTLSNVLKKVNFNYVDILKIDIEGGEEEVICNLDSSLFSVIKIIAMEIHDEIVNKDRLLHTLNKNNFYYYIINETVFAVNKQFL